jgi:MoaA/NifB/PqqE/SkfB family radical SAM enzyme
MSHTKKQRKVDGFWRSLRRTARFHLLDALGMRIKPVKLRLSLTNRCNSRCIMCSIWKNQDNGAPSLPGEITPDEIRRMAQANRNFFSRLTHVSLTGGEPTLRRDFVEVVRAVSEELPNCSLSFNSNGFSTKRVLGLVDQCMAFRRKMTVMISLDGIGEAHTRVRGMKGDIFPMVKATIDGLVQRREAGMKLQLEINTVMTNVNNDQLLAVHEFCRERRLEFNPIYITFGQLYQNHDADVALTDASRGRFLEDVGRIQREERDVQLVETAHLLQKKKRDFDCWAGRLIFLVEENCDVFPNGGCPYHFKLGNLRDFEFSFARLLASAPARAVLAKTRPCRLCQIPCESMTTLRQAEALTGYFKFRRAEEGKRAS